MKSASRRLAGQAGHAAYQVFLRNGATREEASGYALEVREELRERWSTEYLLGIMNLKGKMQQAIDQARHDVGVDKTPTMLRQDHELARLRREKLALMEALAEATGESLTTIGRLYGEDLEEAAA
jgi:hypothetical protein